MAKRSRRRRRTTRRPASPTTSSLRSCQDFRLSRSAASSASPGTGAPSSPTPSTAGSCPIPLPACSTARETMRASPKLPGISPMFGRLGCGLWFAPLCPSFPDTKASASFWTAAILCRLRFLTEISPSSHIASFRYLVCNPATKSWVVLPDSGCESNLRITRMGFDPAVSLHFHVFEFIENEDEDVGVQIYSSKTGTWSYKESEWDSKTSLFYDGTRSVFLNGLLHLVVVHSGVVAVEVEGKTWWKLTVPDYGIDVDGWQPGFLGQYQGQLCYINECDYENDLSIWVLQDYATDDWILKHHVSIQRLCEKVMNPYRSRFYLVITVHPDSNLILYIAGQENTLMAYYVDREEAWVIKNLGSKCQPQYIPYTPFYTESLTNTHS